jgi:hypothetical protein
MVPFEGMLEGYPYGAVGAVCKAQHGGFPSLDRLNGLLCMFNGFAIPKPFCRMINGYSRVGESVRLNVGSAGPEVWCMGGFAEGGTA